MSYHVADGVVLLVDGEYRRIGHLRESVKVKQIVQNHEANKYE